MYICPSQSLLACGLEIIFVAIPMASSYSIYLYNVLNPHQNPSVPRECWGMIIMALGDNGDKGQ